MTTADPTPKDFREELSAAADRLSVAETRLDQFGRENLEELADAYEQFIDLLDRYEDEVVGDAGDYKTNIEFQSAIAELTSEISDDMLLSETFDDCDDHLQQRYFNEGHFDHVREQLEPVGDLVGRLYEYEDALQEYRSLRRDLDQEIHELDRRISDLERLSKLGAADLEAPVHRLREPIETYNDAVESAFDDFRRQESARTVVRFLDAMAEYPLIPFETPPEDLYDYLTREQPGEEPISKLLEYAGYSRSKLDHYVDDPDTLTHVIGGRKTFLSGLTARPLQIQWPPPPALELKYRCRELTAAVNRFDPDVVEHLRAVEALPRETDYDRLRTSVSAQEDLTDAERERIEAGNVTEELDALRTRRTDLVATLEEYPDQ